MKKYELIKTEIARKKSKSFNRDLFQIKALKDFNFKTKHLSIEIKKGDFGGFVESESNLSQDGTCWLIKNSFVCGAAQVKEHAHTITLEDELDQVFIQDNVVVKGRATVWSNTVLEGNAVIKDDAYLSASGSLTIGGDAVIGGNLVIEVPHGECGINKE